MTVSEKFVDYIAENPSVYDMFKKFAFDLLGAGRTRLSGNMLVERVRWETAIQTSGDDYKINDRFTSHLVRKLIDEFPQFDGAFQMRTMRVA